MDENRTAYALDIRSLMDYDVLDKDNRKIGKVESIWEDSAGQPAFLSIRTGWLGMGRSYFVPAHSVEASERSRNIRIPYDEEFLKRAPEFASESDIDEAAEARIYEYYQTSGLAYPAERDWSAATPEPGIAREETGDVGKTAPEEGNIQLKEERLQVGKRSEEAGGVRIRKVVRTETVNQPVELQREEIQIERVPASEAGRAATSDFGEEEIFIPLRRERAEISKTAEVTGEVRARKRVESETRNVQETLRKEDVEVDEDSGKVP